MVSSWAPSYRVFKRSDCRYSAVPARVDVLPDVLCANFGCQMMGWNRHATVRPYHHGQTAVKWSHKVCCQVICQLVCQLSCQIQYTVSYVTLFYYYYYYYCCIFLRLQLCVPAVKCDHRSFVLAQNAISVSLLYLTTKPSKAILVSATTWINHLRQDQLAITSAMMAFSFSPCIEEKATHVRRHLVHMILLSPPTATIT